MLPCHCGNRDRRLRSNIGFPWRLGDGSDGEVGGCGGRRVGADARAWVPSGRPSDSAQRVHDRPRGPPRRHGMEQRGDQPDSSRPPRRQDLAAAALDDVQAAGLTPKQLKGDLARRLAKYISAPEVSVIVREIHSLRVAVLGEVNKPGRYDLKSRASVLDAIALAGGFSPYAARSKLVILRVAGSTVKRIQCNYNKVVAAEVEPESFFLQPGDTLVVP